MTTKIGIGKIHPNPKQPRMVFDQAALMELAASIKAHGLIQPIAVEAGLDGDFVLVSGERRLRALKLNGVKTLQVGRDVIIRERSNHNGREMLVMAIVENVQREDMNPIETAKAYAQLRDEFGMKAGDIARMVGKAPTLVYLSLELLEGEPEIQELWASHQLTHAPDAVRAILQVPAGVERVRLAQVLATRKATGKMIIAACGRYMEMHAIKASERKPAAVTKLQRLAESRPEWEALYQLGKVPPWPALNDAVMTTCDTCSLRSMASEAVCKGCALVNMLEKLMEATHGKKQ